MRRVFFWLHLCAGLVAGAVILVMSVTGVLLTYERQVTEWADGYRVAPPLPGAPPLGVEALAARVHDTRGASPATLALRADPAAPAAFGFGREATLFVDPYTGAVLGEGSKRARAFFRTVTDWHRWLGATGERRATARAITGASNLGFLFIVLSGLYLWWPAGFTPRHLRPITLFAGGLRGKARDFNWHNVVGVWCFLPLLFIVLGATVISYSWATNLVFTMTGTSPQPPPPAPAQKPSPHPYNVTGLNQIWSRAASQAGDWRTITLRLPASDEAPVTFVVDGGYAGQPQLRTTLTLDRASGEVRTTERYGDFSLGRKARTWLRFIHTGEYYGLLGQTIAGLATAGTVLLVYTGVALAWRRLFAWRVRTARVAAKV